LDNRAERTCVVAQAALGLSSKTTREAEIFSARHRLEV
jgi:hypothetical protein